MIKKTLILLSIAVAFAACSSKDKEMEDAAAKAATQTRDKVNQAQSQDPRQNVEDPSRRLANAVSGGVQAVSADNLKTLLPTEMAGLKRIVHEADRAGVGARVSKARAEYGEGDKRMSLMITDLGGVSGLAKMGMDLFETEIDEKSDDGFEKTTTYRGHKAYQRMRSHGNESIGEIMVFVGDRFTVHLDGQNIPFDDMEKGLDQVDLDELVAMKDMTRAAQ